MKDLKQIQEFFSKPLNENKVTKEDFDKVVKVLSTSKYPFTIMLVPKWDEIDIVIGQDAPDEIVDDISQRLDSIGLRWGGNSGITISGASSNYDRREYSDIFRVKGGHKDYFEEAKVEVDDETEFKLDLKHLLDKHVVEQGYSLTKEHETDPNLELKVGDYQTQHFHMCPGAKSLYQDIENKVEDMGLAIRSAKLQDALFAMEESALENGANEADVFAAETIADQIMAMASMMGLDKEHSYIQGHVDKIKGAIDKGQVAENMSLDDQAKAYYLAKVKAGEINTLPEDPKAAFLAQMMKDQMDHDKETLRRERGLEETAAYIAETIKLGLMVNEELCDKGKRYIKARQAAGEKSSAYLSGRAVRVCKGQIEWPKKGKKKK